MTDEKYIIVLNSFEEEQVLRKLKKNALKNCDELVKGMMYTNHLFNPEIDFNDCAKGKALSLPFACRDANKKMQSCVKQFTDDDQRDIYREEALMEKKKKFANFSSI
ncbi:hypothetical protein HDU92_003212 [Lobulomyces angularis]|nr:hypothetical protein HDU92_003212 [Lobulomyces angularis]